LVRDLMLFAPSPTTQKAKQKPEALGG